MGLEVGTFISELDPANPLFTDKRRFGDDHLRLIKSTLLNTFPNLNAVMSASDEELNFVVGVTSGIQAQLDTKLTSASIDLTPFAKFASRQTWTKAQQITPIDSGNVSGAIILNMEESTSYTITAIGDLTISLSNLIEGQEVTLKIVQGTDAPWIITLPSNFHFAFKVAPTFSTVAGEYDVIAGKYLQGIVVCGFLADVGII